MQCKQEGIPMLWYSEKWSVEFADYIKDITDGSIDQQYKSIHLFQIILI